MESKEKTIVTFKDDAEKLKSNLDTIIKEAGSYRAATSVLDKAYGNLSNIMEKETEVIDGLKSLVINAEKMMPEVNNLIGRMDSMEQKLIKQMNIVKAITVAFGIMIGIGIGVLYNL